MTLQITGFNCIQRTNGGWELLGSLTTQIAGSGLELKAPDHPDQACEGEMDKYIDICLVESKDEKLCNFTSLQWSHA